MNRKPSSTARGYTAQYRKARAAILASNPRCWKCGKPATTIDHDPPLRSAPHPRLWKGELKPACKTCNYGWSKGTAQRPQVTDYIWEFDKPADEAPPPSREW